MRSSFCFSLSLLFLLTFSLFFLSPSPSNSLSFLLIILSPSHMLFSFCLLLFHPSSVLFSLVLFFLSLFITVSLSRFITLSLSSSLSLSFHHSLSLHHCLSLSLWWKQEPVETPRDLVSTRVLFQRDFALSLSLILPPLSPPPCHPLRMSLFFYSTHFVLFLFLHALCFFPFVLSLSRRSTAALSRGHNGTRSARLQRGNIQWQTSTSLQLSWERKRKHTTLVKREREVESREREKEVESRKRERADRERADRERGREQREGKREVER